MADRSARRRRRQVERAVLGEIPDAQWGEMRTLLRGDVTLRAQYDRAAAALRILEGDAPVAPFEVDLVERWLTAELRGATTAETAPGVHGWARWRTWLSVGLASAAAVCVVVLATVVPPTPESYSGVRGGAAGPLAIDVLCGDESIVAAVGGAALVSAEDRGCALGDTLAFSYRLRGAQGGVLSLFGVDAEGDTMYYLPTPEDSMAVAVKPGRWRAVGVGVQLAVNHAPGHTRVFGLLSPRAPTAVQVDAMASALALGGVSAELHRPWTRRLDPSLWRALCPQDGADCHAVELSFMIRASARGTSIPLKETP